MSTAPPQQWLLYERRNQAAELRKQITGLMFELCQTFSGSDCDKILDLLVTQCHGMLQQYVDDMQLMIHHTIAAAIQLDISPLTQRVDPATLLVIQDLNLCFVSLFHLQNGLRPNS